MQPRLKKLIALLVLIPCLALYLFGAAALGERVPELWLAKVVYYASAGIAWAFPVRGLMQWANKEPVAQPEP